MHADSACLLSHRRSPSLFVVLPCLCLFRSEYDFYCGLEQCQLYFRSLRDFDLHYQQCHTYKCEVCGLKLPNNRLLEMHLTERHDELFRCMAKTRRMVSHCLAALLRCCGAAILRAQGIVS